MEWWGREYWLNLHYPFVFCGGLAGSLSWMPWVQELGGGLGSRGSWEGVQKVKSLLG